MNLSPPRVFESFHSNHDNLINNHILHHDQPLVNSGLETLGDICDSKKNSMELSNCTTQENHENEYNSSMEPETKNTNGGVSSPRTSQTDHAPLGPPSNTESVIIKVEADACMDMNPPSSSLFDIAENDLFYASMNGCGFNHCIGNSDVDHTNMEVVLHPDYVLYQDNCYTGTKLTFSQYYIQISDSTACAKQGEGAFDIEWAVDDLINFDCHLFPSSGMVAMKLCAVSRNADPSNHISSTSGIDELKIAVVDDNWSLRHDQIKSLNEKYSAICMYAVEDNKNFPLGPRCYFPNFQESFDEVVYPKGDRDAVCLSKTDVDLLKPDTFINDTIIDFYIQYLKSKIQKEKKHRYHFFNCFFFQKLVDMDKNPFSASDGKAAFQRVRKWTRKVNLFEKDYIFVPVNFNFHWSLIVICYPGEAVSFNDKELDKSLRVPCILHMDSIRGHHSGLKNLLQSYLWEEWKARQKDAFGVDLSSRFLNMRFLPVASPQQQNSHDCGLFLLHYLELFLDEVPFNFNPFKLTKFSNFLNWDWFPPAEASLKRAFIQRLIFELVGNENHSSHKGFSSDYSNSHRYSENNENRTNSLCPRVNVDSSTSHSVQTIEFTQLSAPSPLDPQSFNPSDTVLKEHFEPGGMSGTLQGHCKSLDKQSSDHCLNGSIFSIKEDIDLNKGLMYQPVAEVAPQSGSLTYLTRGCEMEISHGPRISIQSEQDKESSQARSRCASDDSDDIAIIESFPIRNETRSSYADEQSEHNNTATENYFEHLDVPASLVEISQWPNTMCIGPQNADQHLSCVQPEHDKAKLSLAKSSCASEDSDDIAIIESFPIRNETRRSFENEQGENNNTAIENYFEHLANFPASLLEISQWPNTMCVGPQNGDQHLSCVQSEHDKAKLSLARSSCASEDSDDIAIIESFPNRNETRRSFENEQGENNSTATENYFEHFPDIPGSLMEISQWSNTMFADHENGDQHFSRIQPQHDKTKLSLARSSCASDDSDDIAIIESFPIRNETRSSYEDERGENNNTAMENSQWPNTMCVSHKNGDENLCCKETSTIQLGQVSGALDDKFTCDDDLLIIDSMESDDWKKRPPKKRRLQW